jgi:alpha-tubulin suppressor-like RCC1 family protein
MPINKFHTILPGGNGELYSCGRNDNGELGIGDTGNNYRLNLNFAKVESPIVFTEVAVGYENHSVALAEDGSIWSWGDNWYGQLGLGTQLNSVATPTQIPGTRGFVAIVAGNDCSMALYENGSVYCFGDNGLGRLGLGYKVQRCLIPTRNKFLNHIQMVSAGRDHGLALGRSDTIIFKWTQIFKLFLKTLMVFYGVLVTITLGNWVTINLESSCLLVR